MNKIQYDAMRASLTGWVANNVRAINIGWIECPGDETTQIRQGGLKVSLVKDLAQDMLVRGQEVPITVENIGKCPDTGRSRYRVVDGEHRYRAIKDLLKKTKDTRWATILVVMRSFNSPWDRLECQREANDHTLPCQDNTVADALYVLNQVVAGNVLGAPLKFQELASKQSLYRVTPGKYWAILNEAIKLLYPAFTKRKRDEVARKFLTTIPGKFKNYDATEAESLFNEWRNATSVSVSSGAKVHKVRNVNNVTYSMVGQTFDAKSLDPDVENVVIIWDSKTEGKGYESMDLTRRKFIEEINKKNGSRILKRGKKLVDRLFIAPQKQGEQVEDGFFEVPRYRGAFAPSRIPTEGWSVLAAFTSAVAAK